MCIDDADGLQIGVDDGGADESHAVRLEIHCDGVGQRGCSHACLVDDVTAGEPPNIVVETAVRRLDIPECVAGILVSFEIGKRKSMSHGIELTSRLGSQHHKSPLYRKAI